ncbi:DUF4258 domain-containing protein [Luteibacter aegosomatissinici]|uniref:DUF4258 domain-containing protein n=1 Tax=Luteibacter aegosomatissinici TaxID=2911539 RepID=UPI001FFA85CD|nr:DUF4258 domain-containing protein [Luteibacter aegosomatissinici]UPG95301.1 DUF4258 domain-containing protein [Luteibacter aegosomatissinici]
MANRRIVPIRLSATKALSRLRSIATDPANVAITRHAESRMIERGISSEQMLHCLRRGHLSGSPVVDEHDNWKFGVELYIAGDHLCFVVAVNPLDPQVLVITAFWVS